MKGLRDEARGTSTTDMNGDDRRPRGFTLAELWAAPSRCARQASATSSTRRAQLLRTRTDAGTVDQPMPQVESCSRPASSFWPEAKVRPGTTSAPAKIRVGGPVRKSVPNYSSVSSSSTKFQPPTSRVHVPNNPNRPQLVPSSSATPRGGPRTAVSFRATVIPLATGSASTRRAQPRTT